MVKDTQTKPLALNWFLMLEPWDQGDGNAIILPYKYTNLFNK